jgi:acyl-CoA synthetase (AMP-forming)/AMP-acid ligase II
MRTLATQLIQHAQRTPDRVAIYLVRAGAPDEPITYAQLHERATAVAYRLRENSIRAGDVVVLIAPHSAELIYAYWGAALLGAVPSILPPLTEKLAPERYQRDLDVLVAVTRPRVIVHGADFAHVNVACALLDVRAITQPHDAPLPPIDAAIDEADIALLQHSSGSTGLQKGVALSHRAIFNQLDAYARTIQFTSDDVIVSWLPLYHDMGLIACYLMPIMLGAPLVLMSPFDWVRAPVRLLQAIARYRGTLCWLPNFAYNFMANPSRVRDRDLADVSLASLRAVINCSEPMYLSSHQKFAARFETFGLANGALATCYAMAENVFAVTQGGIGAPVTIDNGRLSAGKPLANCEVRIVGADGAVLAERSEGEIAIRSDCMLTGYFHREDLTQQALRDGWYLTGDLGYMADGELYITGRKKDLIIVAGKNVYPQDLEQLASEVSGVHPGRVVAFGIMDESAGTEEVVVIAEAETSAIDNEDARQQIADAVRAHLTRNTDIAVKRVEIVDAAWLIKTSSGKIARTANKEKYLSITN